MWWNFDQIATVIPPSSGSTEQSVWQQAASEAAIPASTASADSSTLIKRSVEETGSDA